MEWLYTGFLLAQMDDNFPLLSCVLDLSTTTLCSAGWCICKPSGFCLGGGVPGFWPFCSSHGVCYIGIWFLVVVMGKIKTKVYLQRCSQTIWAMLWCF